MLFNKITVLAAARQPTICHDNASSIVIKQVGFAC